MEAIHTKPQNSAIGLELEGTQIPSVMEEGFVATFELMEGQKSDKTVVTTKLGYSVKGGPLGSTLGVFPKLGEITEQGLVDVYTTNVFGLALLTQEIAPVFKAQNFGNIINIGSTASQKGFAQGSIYAASKFAVRGMIQSWQAELRKDNIRVSLVNPSEVTTAFADSARKERDEQSNKLGSEDVAYTIISVVEMRDKGFVPEITVWATNPF